MFDNILDIKDASFVALKNTAYKLDLDDFEFMIYPSNPGWVVQQTKGNPDIKFLTEKIYENNMWRFRYGNVNAIVNEIVETIEDYNYNLEKIHEEDEQEWW